MEEPVLPKFEIVIDYDGVISEIYANNLKLSEILPTIVAAKAIVDCSDEPGKIEITCYGDTKITYRNEEEKERKIRGN